jgi:hypothetical protein
MIYPIILDHEKSRNYTNELISNLGDYPHEVVDSTYLKTKFTESFNIALIKGYSFLTEDNDYNHVMVCNNDISLNKNNLILLNKIINNKVGIFSPSCNSPFKKVMSRQNNESLREVPWVEFICPIIHKDIIKDVGLLDFDIKHGWGIEIDYCYRAKKKDYHIFLAQDCEIQHYEHQSQDDHGAYSHIASTEMNHFLSLKYGSGWQPILQYPQF